MCAKNVLYRCPTYEQYPGDTIIGCGHEFRSEPDSEGLVDCPHCGIFFKAEQGVATTNQEKM